VTPLNVVERVNPLRFPVGVRVTSQVVEAESVVNDTGDEAAPAPYLFFPRTRIPYEVVPARPVMIRFAGRGDQVRPLNEYSYVVFGVRTKLRVAELAVIAVAVTMPIAAGKTLRSFTLIRPVGENPPVIFKLIVFSKQVQII
jgi:hypothetical protein